MELIEEIKSNEWFHLIDHMYAKWPKVNLPYLSNVEESKLASHVIPEVVRNPASRRQNMKRKRGRKRRSIQKPTKKRALAKVPGGQKRSSVRKEGIVGKGTSTAAVPRRISIIQTRAQKCGSIEGKVRVGIHYRQCPCCEGGMGTLLKPRILAKIEGEVSGTAAAEEEEKHA
ncbi:uncharacterized protein [Hetaerina americana]|uniref:uncharacterized protein n=1 Tax=Hetaerina americana TaxID=62018 RepID=UPI003A7F4CB1